SVSYEYKHLISCFVMILRPPIYTIFPYTTLFRSPVEETSIPPSNLNTKRSPSDKSPGVAATNLKMYPGFSSFASYTVMLSLETRSEEHTSELQSRENLVCRLLLEKKNQYNTLSSV